MIRMTLTLVLALLIHAPLLGCAGRNEPVPPGGAAQLTPGERPIRADDLYPRSDTRLIQLDPETRRPLRVEIYREGEPDDRGVWTQTPETEAIDGAPGDDETERARSTTLQRLEDGGVGLRRIVARTPSATSTDDAAYLFEPALVMAPATLAPGETWEDSCELRVVDLEDESRVIKRGSASRRVEHAGERAVQSESGPIDAVVVRTRMTLDMGSIRSVTRTESWIAPGEGTLVESASRVSSLMGIPVQRARELRVREGITLDGDDQPSER